MYQLECCTAEQMSVKFERKKNGIISLQILGTRQLSETSRAY